MRDFSVKHKFSKYKTIFKLSLKPQSRQTAVTGGLFCRLRLNRKFFKFLLAHSNFHVSDFRFVIFNVYFQLFTFRFKILCKKNQVSAFQVSVGRFQFHASAFQVSACKFQFSHFYFGIEKYYVKFIVIWLGTIMLKNINIIKKNLLAISSLLAGKLRDGISGYFFVIE